MIEKTEQHFLDKVFASSGITKEELKLIIPRYKEVTFNKNEYLLKEGQVEKKYWFIESGFIRSYIIDTEGNDITFNLYASGDVVIDYPSIFFFAPTRENIQALSDCVCWEIDVESFQELFGSVPNYREQQKGLLVGSYFALKEHSISLIADEAKDRYLRLLKEKPHIIQNISLKHIASFLGVTDTSLSRIRKEISLE
ncbi:MAG: Crp/Fnr family transcriptional regulator [Sphingobacteriia bacterium]|jgi:CRP-like cAMP-binding protein|nr:MAG: Crp/Fnr family transcriptional regulator [Sphingobacteriia bacterium]TAG30455.1 MAG: Crp/Fnr family transcriptional regulator [Sphingobacteriia bacterium]TAH09218.1 MAG: Crp/Fnr family transcriptional regulator [Sphingobacteriia bacterium]